MSQDTSPRPVALSIAGSDSGGGAGIQADLRTFSRLGVFGTTAITAVTAQNLDGVQAVTGISVELVAAQMEAVFTGFEVGALKTGMLWSAELVERVAAMIDARGVAAVVDPVMVATSGARLLQEDAVARYRERLIPGCTLVTPNLDEAAVLLERGPIAAAELDQVARALGQRFGCAVLLKGGHLEGDPVDVLWHRGGWTRWRHERIRGVNTHGSGCMLSAALAACLARGAALAEACELALAFVHQALKQPLALDAERRLAGIEEADSDTSALMRETRSGDAEPTASQRDGGEN
ncbi:bifunctional hydroxymethylpyrimidine kinase/phosphomethylpyrimidine kinase [Haliangium ochraceum]|uniref:hydroxymethylpyrimidine kinase n=1 Tax=Haliangium ochraceum (strain DSM 14365 / JCM 11303 / SMP-2) TaxID=502025 RepID=D0LJB6_HALO1|nr:bifunctional hydroxymethylpyrimidine kinase/phosphomethylpyrimidine kinase [Haliangium ochraceum]ACY14963.1 phosphomethylpyrimidine kinase [Haliangium ochraceum DSM 14365]